MTRNMRHLFLYFFLSFLCMSASAQEFTTNEELQIDKLFIEATSQRILGSFEKAQVLYEQVLDKDPLHDAAAYELARVYDSLGKHDEALDAIKKAINLDPENSWYLLMKADILEKKEDYPAAADTYVELIENFPDQPYYYEHLIELYRRMGQTKKALSILGKYETIAGVTDHIIRDQFDLYNQLGDTANAHAALKRLIRTYPYDLEYLHMIATYCVQLGRYDEAAAYHNQILEIDPGNAKARLALAKGYKEEGRNQDYLQSIRSLIANPSIQLDAKIQELIPYTEKLLDQPDSALARTLLSLAEDLVKAHPNEAKSHALKGDILSLLDRQAEARQAYEHTLLLDNSVFTVWEQLLYIQAAQQDFDAVVKTADRALDYFPNQASVYYLSGLAHFRKRNYSEAVSMLDHALIMTAQQPDLRVKVLLLLGELHFESGAPDKAIQAFEKAISQAPQSYLAHQQYSLALTKEGRDLKKASALAERAENILAGRPEIAHIQALIAYQSDQMNKALSHAEQAINRGFQENSEHLELYGDILFSLGKVDEAVEAWQKALEHGNRNPLLPRKIEERKIVH